MLVAMKVMVYFIAIVVGTVAGFWINGYPMFRGAGLLTMLFIIFTPPVVLVLLARLYISWRTKGRSVIVRENAW